EVIVDRRNAISASHRLDGPPFGMLQVDDLDAVIDLRCFAPLKLFPGQAQEFLRVFHVLKDDEVKAVNCPALEAPDRQRFRVAYPFLAKRLVNGVPIFDFPFDVGKRDPAAKTAGLLMLLTATVAV